MEIKDGYIDHLENSSNYLNDDEIIIEEDLEALTDEDITEIIDPSFDFEKGLLADNQNLL